MAQALNLWQKRRGFEAVGDSTWVYVFFPGPVQSLPRTMWRNGIHGSWAETVSATCVVVPSVRAGRRRKLGGDQDGDESKTRNHLVKPKTAGISGCFQNPLWYFRGFDPLMEPSSASQDHLHFVVICNLDENWLNLGFYLSSLGISCNRSNEPRTKKSNLSGLECFSTSRSTTELRSWQKCRRYSETPTNCLGSCGIGTVLLSRLKRSAFWWSYGV